MTSNPQGVEGKPSGLSRERRFVAWVTERCAKDSGFAAALSRADNPTQQSRSWPILASFGVDLERPEQREAYALVGAFLARRRKNPSVSGLSLGRALLASYDHQSDSPAGSARLRRLLSVSEPVEACRILRPMLGLIASRNVSLDAGGLLEDLRRLSSNPTHVKAGWAQGFYRPIKNDASAIKKGGAIPAIAQEDSIP